MANVLDIFKAVQPTATAEAMALALTPIIGRPTVSHYGTYSQISFSENQEALLSEWILSLLRREPGAVRMSLGGVAIKVIARQYWPYILGVAAGGALLGFLLRGGR